MRALGWLSLIACAACFSETGSASNSASSADSSSGPATTGGTSASDATESVGSTSASEGTTGPLDCGAAIELPTVPPGWEGPIVLVPGSEGMPLACPQGTPLLEVVPASDAAPACGCVCLEPPHERCTVTVGSNPAECVDNPLILAGSCTPLPGAPLWAKADLVGGTCTSTPSVLLPVGVVPAAVCVAPPAVDGCIVIPADVRGPCVFAEAEQACPDAYPDPIPSRHVECGACTDCVDLDTYCTASMVVTARSESNCSGDLALDLSDNLCKSNPGGDVPLAGVSLAATSPQVCNSAVTDAAAVSICCAQ